MIGSILNFIAQEMDAFIRLRMRAHPSEQKVILSPLVDLGGGVAIKEENVLVLSLVNIQKDPIATPSRPYDHRDFTKVHIQQAPPVHLNLILLLGAYFKPENVKDGLDTLTFGISYLQGKPLWTGQNSPALPSGLEKLTFELESLDFHQQSHLWGAIGAKYFPSVIYKMRMIIIDDGTIDQIVPTIQKTGTSGPK